MLPYETCCKLKAAGYPQTSLLAYNQWGLVVATANHERDKWAEFMRACPNSDELIAAIQQRWPGIMLGMVWCGDGELWEANATLPNDTHCPACGKRHTPEPSEEGDTPAAALAALYLALAGGE